MSEKQLLRLPDVMTRTALKRSSIYAKVASGAFPKPVKFGTSSAWVDTEVQGWIDARIAERDHQCAA